MVPKTQVLFGAVAQAVEREALPATSQTTARVLGSLKRLVQAAGWDPTEALMTFSADTQQVFVKAFG